MIKNRSYRDPLIMRRMPTLASYLLQLKVQETVQKMGAVKDVLLELRNETQSGTRVVRYPEIVNGRVVK